MGLKNYFRSWQQKRREAKKLKEIAAKKERIAIRKQRICAYEAEMQKYCEEYQKAIADTKQSKSIALDIGENFYRLDFDSTSGVLFFDEVVKSFRTFLDEEINENDILLSCFPCFIDGNELFDDLENTTELVWFYHNYFIIGGFDSTPSVFGYVYPTALKELHGNTAEIRVAHYTKWRSTFSDDYYLFLTCDIINNRLKIKELKQARSAMYANSTLLEDYSGRDISRKELEHDISYYTRGN